MVSYKSMLFRNNPNQIDERIVNLLNDLRSKLNPMEKQGPMSGSCEIQTRQMETFLKENFHFENLPGEYIVQGVKAFQIGKPISSLDQNLIIKFPCEESDKTFEMTVEELIKWQKSYTVYALKDKDLLINKQFLLKALQGQSEEGEEAFQMKFVIRISICPILMEFDGIIIERKLEDDWPNRIKLVSVTGIDFAGRIHDINDILTYINNWKEIYIIDEKTNKPIIANGRDFIPNRLTSTQINEERLFQDLIRMVYLRFYSYNKENIEIVVETGIGLGVFAGKQIGIDQQIRLLSAKAIKYVIENYSPEFSNIRAIIFALPIFEKDETKSTFYSFNQIFSNNYIGQIPILIIDQDMHRLTVQIAKQGFCVSQLNPADSHGVFGEYWQNLGPAVEEKLALTTLGLIIQHHLFNQDNILNENNYHFIHFNQDQPSYTIIPIHDTPLPPTHWINSFISWILSFFF